MKFKKLKKIILLILILILIYFIVNPKNTFIEGLENCDSYGDLINSIRSECNALDDEANKANILYKDSQDKLHNLKKSMEKLHDSMEELEKQNKHEKKRCN